jgi:hypothetical protein
LIFHPPGSSADDRCGYEDVRKGVRSSSESRRSIARSIIDAEDIPPPGEYGLQAVMEGEEIFD